MDISHLKSVQRPAAKFVCNNYWHITSVIDLLVRLHWSLWTEKTSDLSRSIKLSIAKLALLPVTSKHHHVPSETLWRDHFHTNLLPHEYKKICILRSLIGTNCHVVNGLNRQCKFNHIAAIYVTATPQISDVVKLPPRHAIAKHFINSINSSDINNCVYWTYFYLIFSTESNHKTRASVFLWSSRTVSSLTMRILFERYRLIFKMLCRIKYFSDLTRRYTVFGEVEQKSTIFENRIFSLHFSRKPYPLLSCFQKLDGNLRTK